jgi:hypothetical protein
MTQLTSHVAGQAGLKEFRAGVVFLVARHRESEWSIAENLKEGPSFSPR